MKLIKAILFIIIFFVIFNIINNILWLDDNSISLFYKESKNTIDVALIGSSSIYRQINTTLGFDKYGISSYDLSSSEQPFKSAKYLIEEIQKYQNPKLYVIDLSKAVNDFSEDASIRRVVDSMKFSMHRIDTINNLLPLFNNNLEPEEYINHYFSFLMYHNRWKELFETDFNKNKYKIYKGYSFTNWSTYTINLEDYKWVFNKRKISLKAEFILDDLIKYIEKNKLQVLFFVPVKVYKEEDNEKLNYIIDKLTNKGYRVLNINTLNDIKFDFQKEFYDENHLNTLGNTRLSLYFYKYLKENYNLPNHKNDILYKSWELEYERFKKDYKEYTGKNFEELLGEYE